VPYDSLLLRSFGSRERTKMGTWRETPIISGIGESVMKKVQALTKEANNRDLVTVIEALQDELYIRANKPTNS
jgi:NAD-dependent DNA ligase